MRLIAQALARSATDQAFTFAAFGNNDDAEFSVDIPRAIPVTACGANFNFGWNYQFFAHDQSLAEFDCNQSISIPIGSIEGYFQSMAIILFFQQ
ncbi:MAG: hypothetical protein IPN98_14530 [Propionivibrio sp.]|nr:hypothetical protein [Propionivibrio sp.]